MKLLLSFQSVTYVEHRDRRLRLGEVVALPRKFSFSFDVKQLLSKHILPLLFLVFKDLFLRLKRLHLLLYLAELFNDNALGGLCVGEKLLNLLAVEFQRILKLHSTVAFLLQQLRDARELFLAFNFALSGMHIRKDLYF